MVRSLASLLLVLAFASCAQQRYEWNLTHQHLSAYVQKMPEAEVRAITRLISDHCGAPIICMRHTGSTGRYADEIWVVAGDSTTMEDSQNVMFRLKRENGAWRIIDGGYGLSTSLIICGDG